MSPIISMQNDGRRIVLNRPFFAQHDRQADRDLHSHSCVEISYVLCGSADHVLHTPDGNAERQRLSRGNYMILDAEALHAYKNCSADFSLINLLFQKSFLAENHKSADTAKLSELVCSLFPDFPYERIGGVPVNCVCFDRDGSVLSLVNICHITSRKHYHAWQDAVRHALSLILLQSLYGAEEYVRPPKESIVDTVVKYMQEHYAQDLTLTSICAKHFYSLPYVSSRFKEVCGCTFEQYLRQLRVQHAGELLLTSSLSVGEIAERCGYTSARTFGKAFGDVTGLPPSAFRKKYQKK